MTVPSNVVTMTNLLSESVVIPDIDLSLPFALPELNRLAVSGGQRPSLKTFRLMPDCKFHMPIWPFDDPAIAKLPQAETQTAWRPYQATWKQAKISKKYLGNTDGTFVFAFDCWIGCKTEIVFA